MNYINELMEKVKGEKAPKNFYVDVETNGFFPYNTCTVKLRAFEDKEKRREMKNVGFKWYKKIENRNYKLKNEENIYFFSFKDVGYKIIGIITDLDNPHQMEVKEFGPILLDPQTKMDLEGMLISERGNFEVQFDHKDNKNKISEIKDKEDFVNLKIEDLLLDPYNLDFKFEEKNYLVPLKKIEIDIFEKSPLVIKIIFKEKEEFLDGFFFEEDENGDFFFYVKFFTRIFKENFCILFKLFSIIRIMPFLKELEQMESIQQDQKLFKNNLKTSTGDILLIFSNFKEVLKKNIEYTKTVIAERDTALAHSESIENDLKMTLKEFKETLNRSKFENKNLDFSKIEKMENTLLQINKKKENSFIGENVENLKMNENRYNKMKEDFNKMKKLNQLLVKEIKKIKTKKKEKFSKINQSLNNLKELSNIANEIKYQSYLDKSNNISDLVHNDTNSKNDFSQKNFQNFSKKQNLEEIKEENDDTSMLQKQNEILKNEIINLKTQMITTGGFSENKEKIFDGEKELFFLRNCFKDLRNLVQDILEGKTKENLKKSYMNDSIVESVYNAGIGNKIELLNIENSLLLRRVSFLTDELKLKKKNKNSSDDNSKLSQDGFIELNQKVEDLKKQNIQLMKEIDRLENLEKKTEDVYKKQNIVLKQEIEKMKKNNGSEKEKEIIENLKNEIEDKDNIIEQMGRTNSKLIQEIQKLQEILHNTQSINSSNMRSFH